MFCNFTQFVAMFCEPTCDSEHAFSGAVLTAATLYLTIIKNRQKSNAKKQTKNNNKQTII